MLLRLWYAPFDESRLDELNEFARTRSSPMFDSFPGCMGHLFAHDGGTYLAVSMWIGEHAIARAEQSELYRRTVSDLERTGILGGGRRVEVLAIDALNLGWESRRDRDE